MPELAAQPIPAEVRVAQLPFTITRPLGISWLRDTLLTPATYTFLDTFRHSPRLNSPPPVTQQPNTQQPVIQQPDTQQPNSPPSDDPQPDDFYQTDRSQYGGEHVISSADSKAITSDETTPFSVTRNDQTVLRRRANR